MDEKSLNEAMENISLIKGVIDRTSKSFAAFSRIFIYWGLLFIFNSIIGLIMLANKDKLHDLAIRYAALNYIFPIGVIVLIAALIYRQITKKIPLVGLEKHLMKVWLLILVMNIIPSKVYIDSSATAANMSKISVQIDNFPVILFSLAIGLIVTALFAGYRQLMNLGLIYIGISVIYAFLRLPMFESTLFQLIYALPLPFTFLYTGFFLKSRQAGGN